MTPQPPQMPVPLLDGLRQRVVRPSDDDLAEARLVRMMNIRKDAMAFTIQWPGSHGMANAGLIALADIVADFISEGVADVNGDHSPLHARKA